jgi:hypothetical protein
MQVSTARRAARPPPANTKPSHRHLLLGSFLLCPFSQVEDLIVAWAAAEPSPFNSSASGYMTTEEVRASLEAALSAGDVEGADDEQPPDEHAVEAALLALQQRQQDLQEPLGLLSRQRLGIGRLWRIMPPNEDDAAAASATLSRKLALLVNAESATEAERLSAEALDATGEVTSLASLLSALAAAAAPLPSVPLDLPLLVTQAHDILAEHEESAHTRRVRTAASSTSGGKGGAPHRGSSSSYSGGSNNRAAKRGSAAMHGVRRSCSHTSFTALGAKGASIGLAGR